MNTSYCEQTVQAEPTARSAILYALSWAGVALGVLLGIFCSFGIVGSEGEFSWLNLALTLLCLGAAVLMFLRKDFARIEYDYILQDDVLEVWAILNDKRRKQRASIALDKLDSCGSVEALPSGMRDTKPHNWYIHGDKLCYLAYREDERRHMALLELNDKMVDEIKSSRKLARGIWRNEGGRTF